MTPDLRVFADPDELADDAAGLIADALAAAVEREGRATLALSGGTSPVPTYRRLARRRGVDWTKVHVFQVDERCVPPTAPESNARLVREALLKPAGVPPDHFYRMEGEADPDAAAEHYEQGLRQFFGGQAPALDVAVLGVGGDGHVASLFPGSPALKEGARWVLHTHAPPTSAVRDRLTLTLPVLCAARLALFIVTGEGKRAAVRRALDALAREVDDATPPAARVRPADGRLVWLLDAAAGETA